MPVTSRFPVTTLSPFDINEPIVMLFAVVLPLVVTSSRVSVSTAVTPVRPQPSPANEPVKDPVNEPVKDPVIILSSSA